jgi:hypothetical protein
MIATLLAPSLTSILFGQAPWPFRHDAPLLTSFIIITLTLLSIKPDRAHFLLLTLVDVRKAIFHPNDRRKSNNKHLIE